MTRQGALFVGRMKSTAVYEVIETCASKENFILQDQVIRLSSDKGSKDCPACLRRVKIRSVEEGNVLVFISNDLMRTAVEIAALYKFRWQIELFFKWIKQNLKIKRFIGRSENAVKIQVLTAMIAYLLRRLAQITTRCQLSLQQIASIISLNLTRRRYLLELFSDPPEKSGVGLLQNQGDLELG